MSGPKTSRYTLTEQQRRILTEQREIQRRKSVASEKIRTCSKRLAQFGGMFSKDKEVASELAKRIGNDGGFGAKYNELMQLVSYGKPNGPGAVANDVNKLESEAKKLSDCVLKAEKLSKELASVAAENEMLLRDCLGSAIDRGFASSFAGIEIKKEEPDSKREVPDFKKFCDGMLVRLGEMSKKPELPAAYKSEIENAMNQVEKITEIDFLKNYVSIKVNPLLKKCTEFLAEYEYYHAEFDELLNEYTALCGLYDYVPQEFICSAGSVEALKSEIQKIKTAAARDDEQAYISKCLDEVMEEMGYHVLGSREVTKKNGKRFHNELYYYDDGVAVNVTYSPDGKIAMELGGMDTADRLPDNNETSFLCDAMEHFCEDFKEIERRLAAKGVIAAERISMLPPVADYAQIINTSDYNFSEDVGMLKIKRQRHSVKKEKTLKLD